MRFLPILLTSLTTFAGLAPMIFETSSQARFLVPMAIALGFGTFFSVPVVLLLPACLRSIARDLASPVASNQAIAEAHPARKPVADEG